jgi:hypothetical protein
MLMLRVPLLVLTLERSMVTDTFDSSLEDESQDQPSHIKLRSCGLRMVRDCLSLEEESSLMQTLVHLEPLLQQA